MAGDSEHPKSKTKAHSYKHFCLFFSQKVVIAMLRKKKRDGGNEGEELENGSGGEFAEAAISSVGRGTRSSKRGLRLRSRPRASSSRLPRREILL